MDVTSRENCEVLGLCSELNYIKNFEETNGLIASLYQCTFYNLIKLHGCVEVESTFIEGLGYTMFYATKGVL